MIFLNAKLLVEAAIKNNIIPVTEEGEEGIDSQTGEERVMEAGIPLVYMTPIDPGFVEGWYAREKDDLIYELMDDEEGQQALIEELTKIGKLPEFMDESQFDLS